MTKISSGDCRKVALRLATCARQRIADRDDQRTSAASAPRTRSAILIDLLPERAGDHAEAAEEEAEHQQRVVEGRRAEVDVEVHQDAGQDDRRADLVSSQPAIDLPS